MNITRAEFHHQGRRYAAVFEPYMEQRRVGRKEATRTFHLSVREFIQDQELALLVGTLSSSGNVGEIETWPWIRVDGHALARAAAGHFRNAQPTRQYSAPECCRKGNCDRCKAILESIRFVRDGLRRRSRLFDRMLTQEEHRERQSRTRG